jgi:hypothetical protein
LKGLITVSEVTTPTREETVTANIAAVEAKYGPESYLRIITQCAKEIALSTAMLVVGNTSNS